MEHQHQVSQLPISAPIPVAVNRSTRPEDVVETSQSIRLLLIEKAMENGIPDDPKQVAALNNLLNSLDTTALTTRKLNVEENALDVASKVAADMANTLRLMREGGGGNGSPFEAIDGQAQRVDLPMPGPEDLPAIAQVPGHFRQGVEELDYAMFVSE
jgi:hypothetical protein